MSVSILKRQGLPDLAYRLQSGTKADLPVIVFLPGFRSDMEGTKAVFLANHAAQKGQACLRLDYSGHGASGGRFEDGTIGSWTKDALAVIDAFAGNNILLVGSSMGGWIGLLCALARPQIVKAFIGIAAAPDFTRDILARMTEAQHEAISTKGFFSVPSDPATEPMVITRTLLEEGEKHCLLDASIPLDCPVRLLQGMKDEDVPYPWAQRIHDVLHTADKKIILRPEGDHRLSTAEDLAILASLVDEISEKT
jgi:pimeloyl-ACP methyl ester carboxylesterase